MLPRHAVIRCPSDNNVVNISDIDGVGEEGGGIQQGHGYQQYFEQR